MTRRKAGEPAERSRAPEIRGGAEKLTRQGKLMGG